MHAPHPTILDFRNFDIFDTASFSHNTLSRMSCTHPKDAWFMERGTRNPLLALVGGQGTKKQARRLHAPVLVLLSLFFARGNLGISVSRGETLVLGTKRIAACPAPWCRGDLTFPHPPCQLHHRIPQPPTVDTRTSTDATFSPFHPGHLGGSSASHVRPPGRQSTAIGTRSPPSIIRHRHPSRDKHHLCFLG